MRHAASLIFATAIVVHATPALAQQGPCFFTQANYQGEPMCVAPTHRLPTLGPAKNKIMSVQIPAGVRVTVCDLENYAGSCQTLSQSTPDFAAINAAGKVGSVAAESSAPRPPAPSQATTSPPPAKQGGVTPPPAKQGGAPMPPAAAAAPAPAAQPPAKQAAASAPSAAKQDSADPATAAQRAEREAEYIRELRRQLLSLRKQCEDGEKTACVRLGFVLGENRGRRSALRQQHPELFWWDQ